MNDETRKNEGNSMDTDTHQSPEDAESKFNSDLDFNDSSNIENIENSDLVGEAVEAAEENGSEKGKNGLEEDLNDGSEDRPYFNKFTAALLRAKSAGLFITSDTFLDTAIRIMIGLICLLISLINFVPDNAKVILSAAAVIFCGFIVFKNAITDIINKRIITENTLIAFASLVSLIDGYAIDSVMLLFVTEIGFCLRDKFTAKIQEELNAFTETLDKSEDAYNIFVKTSVEARNVDNKFMMYGKIYSYVLILVSFLVAVISLVFAKEVKGEWIHRAMTLLIAASPLPFYSIISLAYNSGVSAAFKNNVIFKNCRAVYLMSRLTSVIFDMTGTICSAECTITDIQPERISEDQLLYLASYAEAYSEHPLAVAIRDKAKIDVDKSKIIKHHEEQGIGCIVQLTTSEIISAGNLELMERLGIKGDIIPYGSTVIYIAVGKTYVGKIEFSNNIDPGAYETVSKLRQAGIANVAMITGDNTLTATSVGRAVGINEIYADCLPKDKYDRVKYIMDTQEDDDKLAFVCRANSNIKALGLADVGITIGEINANDTSADIIILEKEIKKTAEAVSISKSVIKAIKQNMLAAIICELAIIILGLCGIVHMWLAVLINILLAVAITINSSHFSRNKRIIHILDKIRKEH